MGSLSYVLSFYIYVVRIDIVKVITLLTNIGFVDNYTFSNLYTHVMVLKNDGENSGSPPVNLFRKRSELPCDLSPKGSGIDKRRKEAGVEGRRIGQTTFGCPYFKE